MKKGIRGLENLEKHQANFKSYFDAVDKAREEGLKLSRQIGRLSAQAIKKMHQENFEESRKLLDEAVGDLGKAKIALGEFPQIYHSGFLHNAEKELLEGLVTYGILKERKFFVPDFDVFDKISYLHGIAESIGELRRFLLDTMRRGGRENIEDYLNLMDEMYYFMLSFDYQESITRGLRRTVDMMRNILERTRADVTLVLQQKKLEEKLSGMGK